MASSIIHMCIAKKINEKLKLPENPLFLGTIAPDLSKHLNQDNAASHFFSEGHTVDINKFLDKYKGQLKHPFILGYFIHLYTDLLWDEYFISEVINKNAIHLLNGDTVVNTVENYRRLIYNDYTNLNIQLIDEYELSLSLFYEESLVDDVEMDEIDVSKLPILIDHTGVIIQNSKTSKEYVFSLENIIPFIETSSHLIYLAIAELGIF